jgi:hypothetical protein
MEKSVVVSLICFSFLKVLILKAAEANGFDKQLINWKIRIFRRLKYIKETVTLSSIDKVKRVYLASLDTIDKTKSSNTIT